MASDFMKFHMNAAAGRKRPVKSKKKLNEMRFYFSDKINQASQTSFAPAGWLDRISQNCSKKIL
jgi:hypothetical protein